MTHTYNRDAVERAIRSERRGGKRVSNREARLIHSVLQDRKFRPFKPTGE